MAEGEIHLRQKFPYMRIYKLKKETYNKSE